MYLFARLIDCGTSQRKSAAVVASVLYALYVLQRSLGAL